MPPDLALLSTLISSNYPCLELIFMVPKVYKPLKFDCIMRLNPVDFSSSGCIHPVDVNNVTFMTFVSRLLTLYLSSECRSISCHNQVVVVLIIMSLGPSDFIALAARIFSFH